MLNTKTKGLVRSNNGRRIIVFLYYLNKLKKRYEFAETTIEL